MPLQRAPAVNRLLEALPGRDLRQLMAGCETVELALAQVLYTPREVLRHVYFPTGSFISLIMTIGALTVGPQIVAFLGLTGYSSGLDAVKDPDNPFATPPIQRLIAWPMQLALVINAGMLMLTSWISSRARRPGGTSG